LPDRAFFDLSPHYGARAAKRDMLFLQAINLLIWFPPTQVEV
jgi:hypothetical protein